MKHIAVVAFIICAFVAQAQRYVCGSAQGNSVQLTAASIYSTTTPGFDLNTVPDVGAKSCSSDKPFFFSVALPEGSYRVKVVLGGERASTTTVWAEARRLMLEKVSVKAKGSAHAHLRYQRPCARNWRRRNSESETEASRNRQPELG